MHPCFTYPRTLGYQHKNIIYTASVLGQLHLPKQQEFQILTSKCWAGGRVMLTKATLKHQQETQPSLLLMVSHYVTSNLYILPILYTVCFVDSYYCILIKLCNLCVWYHAVYHVTLIILLSNYLRHRHKH